MLGTNECDGKGLVTRKIVKKFIILMVWNWMVVLSRTKYMVEDGTEPSPLAKFGKGRLHKMDAFIDLCRSGHRWSSCWRWDSYRLKLPECECFPPYSKLDEIILETTSIPI